MPTRTSSRPSPAARKSARPRVIPLADAAEEVGLSSRTLRRYVAERRLPAYRVGRRIMIDPSDLDVLVVPIGSGADR